MPVGDKYAFMQFSNSAFAAPTTAGITVTFSTTAQVTPAVRVANYGTTAVYIGLGSQSTSSAAVTTQGMLVQSGRTDVFRNPGVSTLAAFTVGATQTALICVTGGEGML